MLKAKEKQKLIKELGNGAGEIKPHAYVHVQFFKNNIRIFLKNLEQKGYTRKATLLSSGILFVG